MIAAFAVRIRRSHLARHGLLVFAGVVSANAFIYVYYAFVARIVGVAGYGAVSALFSAVLLVGTPPTTVGATIVARLAAELHAAGEFGRLRALGAAVMRVSLSAAAAMFAICAALAQPIAGYLHLNSVAPVLLGAVILALSLIVPLQRALLQGTHSFSAFAVSNLVEAIAKMIAGPFLALSWGVNGALAGFCIGFLVSVLYNAFAFARLDYPRGHALRLGFKATVRSSVGLALAMLMLNIVLFYDVILVRHYFTPFVAGLYGVAVLAGRAVYNIIYFLPTIVLPKAVARAASGASSGSLLAVALAIGAIITLGAAAVAAVEPRSILLLLSGRRFLDAAPLLWPYTLAIGALSLANIAVLYQIALGRYDFVVPMSIAAIGEIVTVASWHPTIGAVLTIVAVGHAVVLLTTFYRLPLHATARIADSLPSLEAGERF